MPKIVFRIPRAGPIASELTIGLSLDPETGHLGPGTQSRPQLKSRLFQKRSLYPWIEAGVGVQLATPIMMEPDASFAAKDICIPVSVILNDFAPRREAD